MIEQLGWRTAVTIAAAGAIAMLLVPSASAASSKAPSAPANLVASAGDAVVHLSWEPAQANAVPVTGYKIYRSLSAWSCCAPAQELLTTVDGLTTAYSDRSVTNGQRYVYAVSAVDGLGEEGPRSNEVRAMPEDPNLPSAPTLRIDKREYAGGPGNEQFVRVYLSWTPGANDGGAALAEYRIYLFDEVIATVRSSQTDYVHRSDACSTPEYRVTAVNGHGEESAFSNKVGLISVAGRHCGG